MPRRDLSTKWTDSQGAFEAFKEITRGRPCDYTGLTYAKLEKGSGIQWPCNEKHPEGSERLYQDGNFNTEFDYCELYGHDLMTGAAITPDEYKEKNPAGKAMIKPAEYMPPPEIPDEKFPYWLSTGRVVYHFHTRTKTGQAQELVDAAPEPFIQMNSDDASSLDIAEGDMVEVVTRRGTLRAPARVGDILPGHLFVPFHYGYFDQGEDADHTRAANELTTTLWDPVSKQPYFKFGAAQLRKA